MSSAREYEGRLRFSQKLSRGGPLNMTLRLVYYTCNYIFRNTFFELSLDHVIDFGVSSCEVVMDLYAYTVPDS